MPFRSIQRRHEICIAVPSGNDMHMEMVRNACTCNTSDVTAEIESLRIHGGTNAASRWSSPWP